MICLSVYSYICILSLLICICRYLYCTQFILIFILFSCLNASVLAVLIIISFMNFLILIQRMFWIFVHLCLSIYLFIHTLCMLRTCFIAHAISDETHLYAMLTTNLLFSYSFFSFFLFFFVFIKCMQSMTMILSRRCVYATLHVIWSKSLLYIFSLINHIDSLHIQALSLQLLQLYSHFSSFLHTLRVLLFRF